MINQEESGQFERLSGILRELRAEHGCPWDKKQTPLSLKKHLLEEVYELFDALDKKDMNAVQEEMGDVYLVTTMMASIFREKNETFLVDVLNQLNNKLIRRHPHVFGEAVANDADEGLALWQSVKATEVANGKEASVGGIFARVGRGLPPLEKSFILQKEAAKVGFHWDSAKEVLAKVDEELGELKEAINFEHDMTHIKEELGDVLFVLTCLAGSLQIDVSEALHEANNKFLRRFDCVQEELAKKGLVPSAQCRNEMEEAWQVAKQQEKAK
ncbi:nucleoside triphosphate pyrophosphohydrolase [Entomospira entomophila]|uniref:Nucleoside triphosphate pyrophosphohydrolase n=1 Tax=Entomospira entomophila TaxID=2719988 RepID=A0A968G7B7_9SPIO|nr:nucleoside triphosphate pyrophosphohydrolase [Entomospira entomophilus]NIZ39942.1 nucleoside triphosphate pyrophosphohydrolase [Entomospira entomophilus]WDI35503.1 nucleoside triphosphate pyrophosphohydrolase [Entomospira entomophilus]